MASNEEILKVKIRIVEQALKLNLKKEKAFENRRAKAYLNEKNILTAELENLRNKLRQIQDDKNITVNPPPL